MSANQQRSPVPMATAGKRSFFRVHLPRQHVLAKITLLCFATMSLAAAGQNITITPAVAGHAHTHHRHDRRATRAAARLRALSLTENIAPVPDFLSSCPATTQSYYCLGQEMEAIDNARAQQGLGPMQIRLAAFRHLSTAEQLFALTDLERTARHLPPVVALTAQLDSVATAGATATVDPSLSGWTLSGGKQAIAWNSNWAGGLSSLAANYYWMYSDGQGFNIDCTATNTSGCWQHRKNILVTASSTCGGAVQPEFVMGAGTAMSTEYGPSDAEILVQVCGGLPADTVDTWTHTEKILGIPLS